MAEIFNGVDMTGVTLKSAIPDLTMVEESKVIFSSGNNSIVEIRDGANSRCVYIQGGTEVAEIYSTTASATSVNVSDTDLGDFGVVDFVNTGSVYFPYLSRVGNSRIYGFTEDSNREEIPRVLKGDLLPGAEVGNSGDIYLRY